MKHLKQRRVVISLMTFGILAVALTVLKLTLPVLPTAIRHQVTFAVFYPNSHNPLRPIRASIKYDSYQQLLTYTTKNENTQLVVSNQPTPSSFTDVPAAYEKVLAGMHPYATFDSQLGKVTLTRPDNLNNQQIAVANTQGTLMFVRANSDMSEIQWRQFFSNLVKIP